ncbi:hypothetical protein ACFVGY_29095 [Streptomyces sp. NPDC127106]
MRHARGLLDAPAQVVTACHGGAEPGWLGGAFRTLLVLMGPAPTADGTA